MNDSSGLKKWTRQIGSSASDNVEDLYVDSNGNVYITGGSKGSLDNNSNAGSYDIFLMRKLKNIVICGEMGDNSLQKNIYLIKI